MSSPTTTFVPTTPRAPASTALRLTTWSADHEVRPSRRTWESLDRVSLSTHHDSLAFRAVAAQPDAPALLAAWTLLIQLAARLPRPLRGYLVAPHGYAYTAADLALMTGFPAPFFTRALEFFTCEAVGLLVPVAAEEISHALTEIECYRTDEEARQADLAAQAAARRRDRRPRATRSPDDSEPSASTHRDSPSSTFTIPPSATALPTEPPPDWRERMLANLPDDEPEMRARCERFVWSELSPALQRGILDLYADPQAA